MKSVLIELHYLPSLEYFCALRPYDEIIFEKHEHFQKQTYRNRCYINTAQGVEMLTVPVTGRHGKVFTKDVRIDYTKKWQNNQWRTIDSAYRSAPYYEHYAQDIHKAIYKGHAFLFDLNLELLSFCLQALRWPIKHSESVSYNETDEGVQDLRSVIIAKKSPSERPFFQPIPYYQVFGNRFVENLSLIDLLFCQGPEANRIISQSRIGN